MRYIWILGFVLLLAACTQAPQADTNNTNTTNTTTTKASFRGAMVEYTPGTQGYYVKANEANAPGVILIHEWWGLNENMKATADSLASEGYNVLAVDLYEGKHATTPQEAMALVQQVDNEAALANMQDALDYLHNQGSEKVASFGYCFGGGQSANLAASGADVDATVIYYGAVPQTAEAADQVRAPVFMVYGTEDNNTPVASARTFQNILLARDTPAQLEVYEGVGHAFANPSNPGHDEAKTADAWEKTLAFLNENLKGEGTSNLAQDTADVTFDLTGQNFKFIMDGQTNPDLRVKQGDRVRVNFQSTQGLHDFVVDELNARTERVWAPNATSVEFTADKSGTFEYYCSVGQHRANGMHGKLIVE